MNKLKYILYKILTLQWSNWHFAVDRWQHITSLDLQRAKPIPLFQLRLLFVMIYNI